jgi:sarcosine oxidase
VGNVVMATGLGGHGFKFLPEIGRMVADLVDGVVIADNPFAFDRAPRSVGPSGHK